MSETSNMIPPKNSSIMDCVKFIWNHETITGKSVFRKSFVVMYMFLYLPGETIKSLIKMRRKK